MTLDRSCEALSALRRVCVEPACTHIMRFVTGLASCLSGASPGGGNA